MVRVVAAALALVVWVGVADAGPKRKVRVETAPAGAVVYVETKENGPACEPTPCTIELPIGESSIIVELPTYNTQYRSVIVPKRGKIKFEAVTLDPAVGTLVVAGPPGASITVNGEDKGKAPAKIELSADTHKVVITKDGKTVFDAYVDVPSGEEKEVEIASITGGPSGDGEVPDEGGGSGDDGSGGGTSGGGDVTKRAPGTPRPAFASLAAAMNVGFRSFKYANNQSPADLRDETESGQVILGPLLEVWPGVLAGSHALRGLSLVGRFQFRLNSQPVTGGGIRNELSTFWQSFEASLRHKWLFADRYGVEVGAGWTREQYRFNGTVTDKLLVPDAQYEAIRLGGRFSMVIPSGVVTLEPYLDLENRIVVSGGPMQDRWGSGTSIGGLKAALGISGRYGGAHVRAEASLLRYSWDFVNTATLMADGGTDLITLIGLYAGYAY